MQPPDVIFGELFKAVQSARIFPDSKTFVDCTPLHAPDEILHAYASEKQNPAFDLRDFVMRHFALPTSYSSGFHGDPGRPIEEHIRLLWDVLRRDADQPVQGSSRIPLPYPYIVPGGRFGEIYYWDSYFTMLGLLESGRADLVRSMLANFAHLIETIGHIPNGNRTYFLTRSQPPFFALMVHELARHTGDTHVYVQFAPAVRKEYDFWMAFQNTEQHYPYAFRRVVELRPGVFLNRYWDAGNIPRQESWIEDVELAGSSQREAAELYRDLRAACESGWDFSSRWFGDTGDLRSICTTSILPVDLNCLLWTMEDFLARVYTHEGKEDDAGQFRTRADNRKTWINEFFWDANQGMFCDYNFIKSAHTSVASLAMVFPLFIQAASPAQAESVAEAVHRFLKPGGLLITLNDTGQQWDAPNGWAPLQWIAYRGMKNYGHDALADQIAANWVQNVLRVYHNTGKLLEKYNVEDLTLEAGGGEYPVQDGFGWTNGVLLKLLQNQLRSG